MPENRLAGVLLPLAVDSSAWNSGLGRASRSLNAFAGGLRIAGFRLALVTAPLAAASAAVFKFSVTAPLAAASAAVFKFSTDFETAMTGVRKTVDPTVKQFDLLNKGILEMSKIIPLPAVELARITQLAGQFGIETEHLFEFTEALAKLSIAAQDLPTDEAAISLARFIELTGSAQTEVTKFASIIALLGDNLATDEGRILDFSTRIAASGNVAGVAAEDILALGGAFSALVSGVERSSTAVERSFGELKTALVEGGKDLETFAFVASKSGKVTREEFAKTLQEDAGKAIQAFVEGIGALDRSGGNAIKMLKDLGLGNIRTRQSFLAASVGTNTFSKAMRLATEEAELFEKGMGDQGKLQREFELRLEDTQAKLTLLPNNIKAAAVILGGSFLPLIKQGITFAIGFVSVLEDLARQFAALPESTRATVLQFSAWLFVAGPLLIALGTIIATIVSLASVLVPLGLGVAAVVLGWKAWSGETPDLADGLLIVFVELIDVFNKLERLFTTIVLALFKIQKASLDASIWMGKLAGTNISLAQSMSGTLEIAIRDLEQRMFKSGVASMDLRKDLDKVRGTIVDLAARVKQGAGGFGDFEDILDEATATLDKIKKEMAATAKNAKDVGEEIAGAGNAAGDAAKKFQTFGDTIKVILDEKTAEKFIEEIETLTARF
ncbi:MAG: phage tail tape measure protein, partial [Candidatus Thorarchaeota archaeon]